MIIQKLAVRFLVLLLAFYFNVAQADTTGPDIVVRNTIDQVLAILKTDVDIENGDMYKLGKLVEENIAPKFDFDRMAQMILGRSWRSASQTQRDLFTHEFRALLIRTYASALSKYRNQTITYKPLRGDPDNGDVQVKTQIIQSGSQPITLDYSLEKTESDWKVYDVIIDGLSLVVTYRGQFAEEVKQSGLDGLIHRLAEKNKQPHQSHNPA